MRPTAACSRCSPVTRRSQRAASSLRQAIGGRWPLLVQGEASRDQLLRRFREAGNAILLGTDSFWEGVDVPGRALRALVLCKLPFKVPSEPLTAARLERLAEQGEDGFMGYLLPHAALKLKQGFGRLIRSQHDVGVVVLLDSRVTDQAIWPAGARRAAARGADHRAVGTGAHQVRRLLCPSRHRGPGMTLVVQPSKIVCIGRNYADHAKELGNEVPKEPLIFLKPPSALLGPGGTIVLPPVSQQVEFEGEIGVVIGKRAQRAGGGSAESFIAGFTCVNDVTAPRPAEDRRPVDPGQGVRHLLPGRARAWRRSTGARWRS